MTMFKALARWILRNEYKKQAKYYSVRMLQNGDHNDPNFMMGCVATDRILPGSLVGVFFTEKAQVYHLNK